MAIDTGIRGPSGIEERLKQLEARQAIIDLLHRLCHAVDQSDVEAWLDCFTDDGVFSWASSRGASRMLELHGRGELKKWFAQHRLDHPVGHQMHLLLHPSISFGTDNAVATSSYCTLISDDSGIRVASSGQYEDSLSPGIDGKWRVAEHHAFGFMPGSG